jgi:hypothetical protein
MLHPQSRWHHEAPWKETWSPLEGGKKPRVRASPPRYIANQPEPRRRRQTSMNKNCLSPLRGLFVALSYRGLTPPAIFSTPLRGFMPYREHLQHIKTPGYFLNALKGLHAVSQPSATHQKHPAIFSPPLKGFMPYRKHLQHIKTPGYFLPALPGLHAVSQTSATHQNTRLFSPRPSRASCRIATICNTIKNNKPFCGCCRLPPPQA